MPKVTCLQGQRLLIGQQIGLTVKAIYKKRDGMRCVMLDIETPAGMLVFQERLATDDNQCKSPQGLHTQAMEEKCHDDIL